MAVRKFEFTVKEDGIAPATEQKVSIQTEHAATELVFSIEDKLFTKLQTEKGSGSLVYRFDCYDSSGGTVSTDASPLESKTVTLSVGESITRHGGKAAVYLVITAYGADNKTTLELLSYPARLRFENIPEAGADNGASRESFSTLASTAKGAAENAAASAEAAAESAASAADAKAAAEEAKTQTAAARVAIESGSEFLFDGGGADESLIIECVTDPALSETSGNPVANKAISARFKQVDTAVAAKADSSAVAAAISAAIEQAKSGIISSAKTAALDAAHPIGSIYLSVSETSPAAVFGGAWERIAKGRTLIGAMLSSDADYDADFAPLSTGGEKVHTLTADEMPAHSHGFTGVNESSTMTDSAGNYPIRMYPDKAANWNNGSGIAETGGGQAHNNMPPYLAVYIWKRVS